MSLAGQPTDRFLFAGFLPAKAGARDTAIAELSTIPATLVFLEAPHRLDDTLAALAKGLGDRPATVLRELTKRHEEIRLGTLPELAAHYAAAGNPKGEIVLVIAPPSAAPAMENIEDADAILRAALATMSVKEASNEIAKQTGLPKRDLYNRALQLKDGA